MQTESDFVQKLASESGATKMTERIKTASQAVADAEKVYEASQSELRKAKKDLEAAGFCVDGRGTFSLHWDAPESMKQVLDTHLSKLEKENNQKLHEYDVATLNVWAAETADEAKKFVEGLV
jgi:dienelactone hydrolase